MSAYPRVLSEMATLDLVLAGHSLARYGDGEFKLCRNVDGKSQRAVPALCRRLRDILIESGDCLVGIPNIHSPTPKAEFWQGYAARWVTAFLAPRAYVSSFVSRPDSAPWIDQPLYWAKLKRLWRGRNLTLLRGSGKSLTAELLQRLGAGAVNEIVTPAQHAFARYGELLAAARRGRGGLVLLCCGPAATVLAADLAAAGVQAVDLGHVGMFLKRRPGETAAAVLDRVRAAERARA